MQLPGRLFLSMYLYLGNTYNLEYMQKEIVHKAQQFPVFPISSAFMPLLVQQHPF